MRPLLLIVAVSAIGTPTCSCAEDNTYCNPTLGIAITKPDDWHFITAAEVAANLENVQLPDEKFDQLIKKHATAPIVAMTKHKEPYDDLNPSIKIDVKPLRGFPADQSVQLLQIISRPIVAAFPESEFVTRPKKIELSGLDAAYMSIDFSLTIPDGRTFPTRSEVWLVPRGKMFFLIGIGTRPDEKTGTRAEVHKIIESIVIDPEPGT